ncbi:Tat pathway signal protein, partial [Paucibacter sp. XJ19-41]|nr:Tat pathway signal protein [Paucibacter sp. XJ19-41]
KALYDAGKLGLLLNVGTLVQPTTLAQYKARSVPLPPKLFSHNDQSSIWQSSMPEGATSGWGGRLGDQFLSANGNATFTCINVSGNAVFMSGQQAVQYQMSSGGAVAINGVSKPLYGSQACADALRSLITAERSHWMEQELNRVVARSVNAQSIVAAAMSSLPALSTAFDATNSLAV